MRFNKLDLNLLPALNVLLAEASISRAAERMHLSQSAMSGALARLREHFDDPLLVQVGRRMELTPRAEVLRDAVHDVLLHIDATVASQPAFDPATSDREFRLSTSDYTLLTLMSELMALAHRQAPRVRFRLVPQVQYPTRALDVGEADLIVIPEVLASPDHPFELLLEEHFVCVVWEGSPLAHGELTMERYCASGHVVMVPVGTGQDALDGAFVRQHGIARRVEVSTFSVASMPALVVGTHRIATVHHSLARRYLRDWPVRLRTPPFQLSMRQGVQWHKYRSQDPGLRWLRQQMQDAARHLEAATAQA